MFKIRKDVQYTVELEVDGKNVFIIKDNEDFAFYSTIDFKVDEIESIDCKSCHCDGMTDKMLTVLEVTWCKEHEMGVTIIGTVKLESIFNDISNLL